MPRNSEPVLIGKVSAMRETPAALLVRVIKSDLEGLSDNETAWIPKSLIGDDSECHELKSEPGRLYVPEWFAEEKGWS